MKKFFLFLSLMLGSMCYFPNTAKADDIITVVFINVEHLQSATQVDECEIGGQKYTVWKAVTRSGKVYTYLKDSHGNIVYVFKF